MAGLASTSQDLAAQHVAQFESFITHATEPGGPLAQLRSIVSCSQQEAASSHHAIRVSGSDISDYDHALGNALMQQPLVMLPRLDEALRVVVLAPRPTATAVAPELTRTLCRCSAAGYFDYCPQGAAYWYASRLMPPVSLRDRLTSVRKVFKPATRTLRLLYTYFEASKRDRLIQLLVSCSSGKR